MVSRSDFSPQSIENIAEKLGVERRFVIPWGRYRAKIDLDQLQSLHEKKSGRYVLVTAITPTPFGEGKTTVALGLSMALNRLGHSAICSVRQSSLGPTFGIKGGGAGGGRSRVIPLAESILHLTGDIHAVGQAHNLIAAMTDNSLYHKNPLGIDLTQVEIRRVVDVNDRFLRSITVGQGKRGGLQRQSGFDITVASELMAILALVDGQNRAEVLRDLRQRIDRMVVAFTRDGRPVSAGDIGAAGAATVLLREAVHPNLMQSAENTPVLIHAGPFANIAHGNSSIVADRLGLKLADFLVTEAGFGSDIGAEKFFNIKCRRSGLQPSVAVMVCTIRALKAHSGNYKVKSGKPLPPEILLENPDDVRAGGDNLRVHIENLKTFGIPCVVAINRFPEDHSSEIEAVRDIAESAGASGTAVCDVYQQGGAGGIELARLLVEVADNEPSDLQLLYPDEAPLKQKIERIATRIYRADGIELSDEAAARLAQFEEQGAGRLPICMAKTPLSLSHKSKLKGVPRDYLMPIRDVRLSAGAGFIYPLAGSVMTMPGLASNPAATSIDIDENGEIVGLF